MKKIMIYLTFVLILTGCTGEQIYKSVISSRLQMTNLTLKQKDIGEGLTMHYYENNVRSKETLVLLHGFTDNKETWLVFVKGLLRRYHVIIPDQIGFGASSKPMDIDYSLETQTERLHTFLSTFPKQKFVVMGNSMGGGIALKYASKYPVEKLILVGSMGVEGSKKPYFSTLSQEHKATMIYNVCTRQRMRELLDLFSERVPYIPTSVLDYMMEQRCASNPLIKKQHKYIFDDNLDVRHEQLAEAKMIDVPTLILWGRQDKMIDVTSAYKLNETIPDSRMKIYQNVGHIPMQDIPFRLAKDVRRFLR